MRLLPSYGAPTGDARARASHAGVAAALALLDLPPSAKLPPLECLFTVDEETGLTGGALSSCQGKRVVRAAWSSVQQLLMVGCGAGVNRCKPG